MLVCGGTTQATMVLKEVLTVFSSLSGLIPNHAKSTVFVAGDNEALKASICDIFGFTLGSLPVKYLGFLLSLPD